MNINFEPTTVAAFLQLKANNMYGRAGELNADIGNGGPQGESWIDVFALSSLLVSDGTGNDRVTNNGGGPDNDYFNTFAVHAKGMAGSDQTPNDVTAKVTQGPLTSTGDGFMAGSDDNGSNGGTVVIESRDDLNIDTVKVGAGGDGSAGDGGSIGVRSYDGDLTWQNGDGDVDGNPNGTINLSTIRSWVWPDGSVRTVCASHTLSSSVRAMGTFLLGALIVRARDTV